MTLRRTAGSCFQLKSRKLLVAIALTAILVGVGVGMRWHFCSMSQFEALTREDEFLLIADFSADFYFDSSGLLVTKAWLNPFKTFQAWLCRYCDPRYVLPIDTVYPPADDQCMALVAQLKGCRRIVFLDDPGPQSIQRWKARFPRMQVESE